MHVGDGEPLFTPGVVGTECRQGSRTRSRDGESFAAIADTVRSSLAACRHAWMVADRDRIC